MFSSKKITITSKTLSYSSLLKKRSIARADIRGYRMGRNTHKIKFYTNKESQKKVISAFFSTELSTWAKASYPDLDQIDFQAEKAAILVDKNLGATQEERASTIKRAEIAENGIVVVCALVGVLSMFVKLPYLTNIYCSIVACLWMGYALIASKGLVRMEWRTARTGMHIPTLMIGFVTATGFSRVASLNSLHLILPITIVVCCITIFYILFIVGYANYKFKKIGMNLLLFFIITYSFTSALNIALDFSEPLRYETSIAKKLRKKSFYARYGTTYYTYELQLTPWKKQQVKFIDVDISSDTYKNIGHNARVEIKEYKGFFGDTWFTVHLNGEELLEYDVDFFLTSSE